MFCHCVYGESPDYSIQSLQRNTSTTYEDHADVTNNKLHLRGKVQYSMHRSRINIIIINETITHKEERYFQSCTSYMRELKIIQWIISLTD